MICLDIRIKLYDQVNNTCKPFSYFSFSTSLRAKCQNTDFSGLYFPASGPEKNSVFGHFSQSAFRRSIILQKQIIMIITIKCGVNNSSFNLTNILATISMSKTNVKVQDPTFWTTSLQEEL